MKPQEPETGPVIMLFITLAVVLVLYLIGQFVWGMEQIMVLNSRLCDGLLQCGIEYFWEIMALIVAPLFGFVVGQYYKASCAVKPSNMRIAMVAGGATALSALLCWTENHSLEQAAKIALFIGVLQPLVVSVWFMLADRFAPRQACALRGHDDEITIIPWMMKAKIRNGNGK